MCNSYTPSVHQMQYILCEYKYNNDLSENMRFIIFADSMDCYEFQQNLRKIGEYGRVWSDVIYDIWKIITCRFKQRNNKIHFYNTDGNYG